MLILNVDTGPIVRIGPDRISINTSTGLRDIYSAVSNVQKGKFYSIYRRFFNAENTVTTVNRSAHARKRRVLKQALSPLAVESMEHHILENTTILCSELERDDSQSDIGEAKPSSPSNPDGWSSTKNLAQFAYRIAFDNMGSVCFGTSFNTLTDHTDRSDIDLTIKAVQCQNIVSRH